MRDAKVVQYNKGLERWLSGGEQFLLFLRTQVQFPAHKSGNLQLPVTLAPSTPKASGFMAPALQNTTNQPINKLVYTTKEEWKTYA